MKGYFATIAVCIEFQNLLLSGFSDYDIAQYDQNKLVFLVQDIDSIRVENLSSSCRTSSICILGTNSI